MICVRKQEIKKGFQFKYLGYVYEVIACALDGEVVSDCQEDQALGRLRTGEITAPFKTGQFNIKIEWKENDLKIRSYLIVDFEELYNAFPHYPLPVVEVKEIAEIKQQEELRNERTKK